ncbi:MAG: copper amine oxidase N-terminal domain-containing protein [Eubacteriales bacterium]|nr:copper amine oxidase N-terminal domain-containing protein [Eubacteriales bacterium]
MKRKIAILLATTMTLSAVPAFAANTAAPAVEGSVTTGVSGQVLTTPVKTTDLNVTNKTNAEATRTLLSRREGVLKIALNKGNSSIEIPKGATFEIKLQNAKFNVEGNGENPDELAYKNISFGPADKGQITATPSFTGKTFTVSGSHDNPALNGTTFDESKSLADVMDLIKPYTGYAVDNNTEAEDEINASVKEAVAPLPHVPYSIKVKDDRTAEVKLLSKVTFQDIDSGATKVPNYYKNDDGNKKFAAAGETEAYIAIPLGGAIVVDGSEDVKVDIIGYGNQAITDGTVTLAKVAGTGSTSINTRLIEKKVFEDKIETLSDIVIQENVRDSFKKGEKITLRLNSGFQFKKDQLDRVSITDPTNSNNAITTGIEWGKNSDNSDDYTRIQFTIPDGFLEEGSKKESLRITLPGVQPVNEDKNYGEVSLTVYGGGISEETVVIAERQKLGFKLETKTEVPTITKGRYYAMNDVLNTKGNYTAEVELSELVPNSLLSQRSVDFKVPEGVKIADLDVVSMTNMKVGEGATSTNGGSASSTANKGSHQPHISQAFEIINDGTTLRLNRDYFKTDGNNKTASIRLKLKLSVDAGYDKEDITLSVNGGGISQDITAVVAKVENPFIITAEPKNINIGYQNYSVNDITITEAKPGMFMEGENVEISITAPYGTQEMGFTKANVSSTGNLEIRPTSGSSYVNTNGGTTKISINIKAQSTKEPASIKLSNVEIGTTRSVPFGAYNLNIGGRAVINNDVMDSSEKTYDDTTKGKLDNVKESMILDKNDLGTDKKKIASRIDAANGSYTIKGYVNVVTATDTIDKEMKVTIGSTTAMIDGKEVTMDVAPYIQANGNTMVPLRFVTVALAGGDASSVEAAQNSDKISWDPTTKTVTIFYGAGINQKIIQFRVGSTTMIVDGNSIPMENGAKAEIKNGRTFVPFRSLGQALGVPVSWDATTKTAIFNQK